MKNKYAFLAVVVLFFALIVSAPTPATADDTFLAAGISMSGANSAGMKSRMNGGVLLDGEYAGDKFTLFGSLGGVQLEKLTMGVTQQIDARSGGAYHFTDNFEAGVGFRYSLMRFTEIGGERVDTAPYIVANLKFRNEKRLMAELHFPDSSQYETRAVALAFEQKFGRGKNYRFRAKFDYAQYDYNAPIGVVSASQEGLMANTKSSEAPPGFKRETKGSPGYALIFSYVF